MAPVVEQLPQPTKIVAPSLPPGGGGEGDCRSRPHLHLASTNVKVGY
jgi:hypothetical protein